jgi:hypothetical protein
MLNALERVDVRNNVGFDAREAELLSRMSERPIHVEVGIMRPRLVRQ